MCSRATLQVERGIRKRPITLLNPRGPLEGSLNCRDRKWRNAGADRLETPATPSVVSGRRLVRAHFLRRVIERLVEWTPSPQ